MIMDAPTKAIVDFVSNTHFADLTGNAVHAIVRNYVNCVACGAAGFDGPPTVIARHIAEGSSGNLSATTYGVPTPTLVEFAAFANSLATRYCDWNDAGGGGHPSDMSPAIVAIGEAVGASPEELVCAMFIGYETTAAISRQVSLRDHGWDQGFCMSLATVAGVGRLLQLDDEQLANAIAIAVTPSIPMRVSRTGELSNWKGAATAHATMTAVFAARLAMKGMTGPRRVFDGIEGVFQQVTGTFELTRVGPEPGGLSAHERVSHKFYPAELNCQSPVALMLKLRGQVQLDDIEGIQLSTYEHAWHECAGGQGDHDEKWDPKTRETADHSLPYYMAVALIDGQVTLDSFTEERIADPALRPWMEKITVVVNDHYTENWKSPSKEQAAEIRITLKDGRALTEKALYPKGHRLNPLTDEDFTEKFNLTVSKVLDDNDREELLDRLWTLPEQKSLAEITRLLSRFSSGPNERQER